MKKFREFYTNNKERYFGYLLRRTGDKNLAADTLQESFTKYLERYGKSNLQTALLYTIGRNLINDLSRKKHPTIPYEDDKQPCNQDQENSYILREKTLRVQTAINKLSPRESEILSMVVGKNLSYRKIASKTGISEANIKVMIHRIRIKIKTSLNEDNYE